ncbi:MAG: hypothetical protein B1H09_04400, partial [Gemmatimonadaceae bacterium 4484_173]
MKKSAISAAYAEVNMLSKVIINTEGTTLDQVGQIVDGAPFELGSDAVEAIKKARSSIQSLLNSGKPIYGVNTGFGRLASTIIQPDELGLLQRNLLLSHACSTGKLFPPAVVRTMIFLRVVSLARGRSGIRLETVEALIKLGNSRYLPVVPSQGSLGASGDLAPLAHMCLPILGEGECIDDDGVVVSGAEALEEIG